MKSVIVISSGQPDLSRMSKIYSDIGSVNLQSPKRLVVEGQWGWFAIGVEEQIEGEFSDAERKKIERLVPEPVYAQLEYSNPVAADLAIGSMPAAANTLIDNDHGIRRPIGEIRELIRTGMEWQTSTV